jgi:Ca-activated chloride channel family protein
MTMPSKHHGLAARMRTLRRREWVRRGAVALVGVAAAWLAGCSPAPRHDGGYGGGDGSLEEIVVSGSRIGGRTRDLARRAPSQSEQAQGIGNGNMPMTAQPAPSPLATDGEASFYRPGRPGGPPLSRVQAGEEVWVIATAGAERAAAAAEDDSPGSGTMLARVGAEDEQPAREIPLPLEHTDVRAVVTGYIGSVEVTQQFANPYDEKIEAVYLFPLPEKAAVSEFVMTIGERKIRGILREREEAERIYRDARAQGYRASLLTQHRPNVFEQKVANIEPGKRIDVNIRYFHTLAYEDGWYSFVFPTVVGPRYNPAGWKDPVAALPRTDISERATGTAVRYLRPSERSAHDLRISVDVDAGVAIEELDASHPIRAERDGESAHVELAAGSTIPNRDFVLRFRVAGDTIKSNLLTYTDPSTRESYFTLMLYPPALLDALERSPVEMVFVLDTSGSMAGRPLEQAVQAVDAALDRLGPQDTFQILDFSDRVSRLGPVPLPVTRESLAAARRYLRNLGGGGGTEMLSGIRAALGFERDAQRTRYVTFLTDGYIGNESEILAEVRRTIGSARIFSFGVGNAVNRYLLDGLAAEGRGAAAYLALEDSAADIMRFFFERVSHPALTDVVVDWNGIESRDVYPKQLPDLFVGRPVVLTGRYTGEARELTVRGRAGGREVGFGVPVASAAREGAGIRNLWARLKIEDLSRRELDAADAGELAAAIRATALEHGLMSAYTSFVAVDASERTVGERGTTVHQAVPVPDGVRYDTSVAER